MTENEEEKIEKYIDEMGEESRELRKELNIEEEKIKNKESNLKEYIE